MGLIANWARSHKLLLSIILVLLLLVAKCAQTKTYSYKEVAVPESIPLSPRLQGLFSKTKLVCFGRYALEVPIETELNMGSISIPANFEVISGGIEARQQRIADDIKKIRKEDPMTEFTYNGVGPVDGSWQTRYSDGALLKELGVHMFETYVNLGEYTFIFGDSTTRRENETEKDGIARQDAMARGLRLRSPEEVPNEPGYCIEHAFVRYDKYSTQEMVSAGIYLPSHPDVTFSISSNKDAYGDYSPEEFEKRLRGELSMLARINAAQKEQGIFYPRRNVLREGKRNVHHWRGEESLFIRPDGTHDFEWALVGTPGDVANPSEFSVKMYTKVARNIVGAAEVASLSDDEAVALWDKLLDGLKFRVKVPGSPPGSYFLEPKK